MADLDIQISVEEGGWPSEDELQALAERVLGAAAAYLEKHEKQPFPKMASELSLVFTDDASIREINAEWREQDKATNVLSFPAFPLVPGGKPSRCWATLLSPKRRWSVKRSSWKRVLMTI